MKEQQELISHNILANMSDGVMTVDLRGQIITFNLSASQILGLKSDEVIGKSFAEVFISKEGSDAFIEAILDAVYESNTIKNRIINYNRGDKTLSLQVTTSFLKTEQGDKIGVIAVFNDITEIQQLREQEQKLTEEIKQQHQQLQNAYLKIQESNSALQSALKKVQFIRSTATAFIIVLFVGIGLFFWGKKYSADKQQVTQKSQIETTRVSANPISHSIHLTGKIEPLQVINISSPFAGKVQDIYYSYGDTVKAGQVIIKLDTSELEIKLREAKSAYIKAEEKLAEMEKWESSNEVTRAKRSLTKAKMTVDSQKKTLDETERLLKKGIIPSSEYDSARQQYENSLLDYKSAQEELQAVLEKGSGKNKKIAKLEMDNAHSKYRELEEQLSKAIIKAPVDGVILMPSSTEGDKTVKKINRGVSFQQGDIMFSIGNIKGFSVRSGIDEVDITKVQKGQKARITGDAFSGIILDGVISHVSIQTDPKQASMDRGRGGATPYEIIVSVLDINEEQRKKVLVGMSANLEVIVYERPKALMVPVSAVFDEGNERYVKKKAVNKDGSISFHKVPVQIGYVTIDAVEIISGLNEGDEILVK